MFRSLFSLFFIFLFSVSKAETPVLNPAKPEALLISKKFLTETILVFNNELRNRLSGQYEPITDLSVDNPGTESLPPASERNSSIAATGIGLITLALGDATGTVSDANIKSIQTLAALLNPKFSKRHSLGWMRRGFTAQNGHDNSQSVTDGYSTVDTAILAAGAIITCDYFKSSGKDSLNVVEDLTNDLLNSVNWESAIADRDNGRLYINFDLESEAPKKITANLRESILVSCIGKLVEARHGASGEMSEFWNKHFAARLPRQEISNLETQLAYYLCGDVNQKNKIAASNMLFTKKFWQAASRPAKR